MLPIHAVVERVVRRESGKVLASLIRVLGDFDVAEDALQDALRVALERWPEDGIPASPSAWITTTARRRAIDRLRRTATANRYRDALSTLIDLEQDDARADPEPREIEDERLRLIFTCCHPSLSQPAQVALTLRTLGGLSTAEIAAAFLVPEATMAQRLVRAKQKIRLAGVPYEVPGDEVLAERLEAVLSVVYLAFNEGYWSSSGQAAVRVELCDEAIRLALVLRQLMPEEAEVQGLLALMILHHARRRARDRVLEEQDRSLWHAGEIAEGTRLIQAALRLGRPGPYQLQAAIAALHSEAPSFEETDFRQIAALYAELARRYPSEVVELNRAVAASMVDGPELGSRLLERLSERMAGYQPYHAARADLFRRAGRLHEAAQAYAQALEMAPNQVAREFLSRRLCQVRETLDRGRDDGEAHPGRND